MKKILVFVLVALALVFYLRADVYVKSNTHTDPMSIMGQENPAKDVVMEQWFGKDKMVLIMADRLSIIDMAKKMLYVVKKSDKTYVETPLPLDMNKLVPPEAQQMLSMMKVTAKVTPNGQTQKIDKWTCNGYDVDMNVAMMAFKMQIWATADVPFDWKQFAGLNQVANLQMIDDATLAEFKKIQGFSIQVEVNGEVMGQKIHTLQKVLEITQKPAPAGIYSIPAGFTKVDKLSLQDLMGNR